MEWDLVKELIIGYARMFVANEIVQENKDILDQIKQLSQKEIDNQEKVLEIIFNGVKK